jgi:ribosomal protein S18 acetylase RimI-like enzyme
MNTHTFLESRLHVKRGKTLPADVGKHLDTLNWLHLHCFPGDVLPDWAACNWWIVWDTGKPIAFIGVEPVKSFKGAVHISRVGVAESHRGLGWQKFLMDKVTKAASGLYQHVISTTYENPISANNFIRCGFRTYAPAIPWGATGTVYWIKDIA